MKYEKPTIEAQRDLEGSLIDLPVGRGSGKPQYHGED